MRPLVCIRHQETAPLGVIQDVLDEASTPWTYLDTWTGAAFPDLADVAGLLILGGEMNVDDHDRFPYLLALRAFTRDAIVAEKPVLGVCLGAQVMTRSLDAEVYPMAVKEIGFKTVTATSGGPGIFGPFAPAARVFQFHEDACELPSGAELLFEGDLVPVQAYRLGERAYAAQFHFEVTMGEIESWCDETPDLQAAWGVTKEDLLQDAKQHLAAQQVAGRDVTRGFLGLL